MDALVTNGIRITVDHQYMDEHSNAMNNQFLHSYQITICNESRTKVQLLRRHWYIQNAKGNIKEVEGIGVIGKQPSLDPGETHQYVSWSSLDTDIGKMYGYYTFIHVESGSKFKVQIPTFQLIAPFKGN